MKKEIIEQINEEFKPVSKDEWLKKVEQDLKGKPYKDLYWHLNNDMEFSPIYTKDDIVDFDTTVLSNYDPDWEIGEHYLVSDYKKYNKILLADLNHGLNAPLLSFETRPSVADFNVLFNDIGLAYINTHILSSDAVVKENFYTYLDKQNIDKSTINVSFLNDDTHVNATAFYKDKHSVKQEIDKSIEACNLLFDSAVDKESLAKQLSFSFFVDKSYFLSIAKLRAFKLRYIDVLKKHGLPLSMPYIYASFAPAAYGDDEHDNLINATSMAMSAVLGGVNHLVVRPTADTKSAKRLARNVQLILKHESGLHTVVDPAQGSYYIESITKALYD